MSFHGNANGYTNRGCRCDECCAAHTAAARRLRRSKNGLPAGDPRHGTRNAYKNWNCRCAQCKKAHADDSAYYRRRARQ